MKFVIHKGRHSNSVWYLIWIDPLDFTSMYLICMLKQDLQIGWSFFTRDTTLALHPMKNKSKKLKQLRRRASRFYDHRP